MGRLLSYRALLAFFIVAVIFTLGDALYTNDGTIHVLYSSNITEFIPKQPTLVQFYLSNCGACQSYAPIFQNVSKAAKDWQWAVKIAVIDCTKEENNRLVRAYNVSYFPQILFFSKATDPKLFDKAYSPEKFRRKLANVLLDSETENEFIQPINTAQEGNGSVILSGTDKISNALIILDFHDYMRDSMRSFIDTSLAEGTYSLTSPDGKILLSNATEMEVRNYLKEYFALDYARAHASTAPSTSTPAPTSAPKIPSPAILPVYAADMVAALKHALFKDVGLKSIITGADLDALKEFIDVVGRYLILDSHYNLSIESIKNQLSGQTSITANQWSAILEESGFPTTNVKYVACKGSQPQFRGYPCGLWIMFHAMTAQRFLESQQGESSLPSVAHAINRFIPSFFSCGYCAFHFAALTSNVRYANDSIFPTRGEKPPFELVEPPLSSLPVAPRTPRDEVLWLNTVHNRVNKRLAGHPSDDPDAPKGIFPSPYQCPACWSPEAKAKLEKDRFSAMPDREEELFAFLLHHYRPSSWKWTGLDVSYSNMNWTGRSPRGPRRGVWTQHTSPDRAQPRMPAAAVDSLLENCKLFLLGQNTFRYGGFTTGDLVLVAFVSVGCTLLVLALVYFVACGRRKRLGYRTTIPA